VDCVQDVAAIADVLEIGQFAVLGGSGGGPHALAVAARLPDRVERATCAVTGGSRSRASHQVGRSLTSRLCEQAHHQAEYEEHGEGAGQYP
jgi:pimeloyl-ACP methyl ester carboxylesterase